MTQPYTQPLLQRILDQWAVGVIRDFNYFGTISPNVWRHSIETEQGRFELYSYPIAAAAAALPAIAEFHGERWKHYVHQFSQQRIVHSLDYYHTLVQLEQKLPISAAQAAAHLEQLIDCPIWDLFRVYGTILQIHLGQSEEQAVGTLVSYGWWNVDQIVDGKVQTIANARVDTHDHLDTVIGLLAQSKPRIVSYALQNKRFEITLSSGHQLQFMRSNHFPALEVHIKAKKDHLAIFTQDEMCLLREY